MLKILDVVHAGRNMPKSAICTFKEGAGAFRLNKLAIEQIGLQHGDLINFAYDDSHNRFYIFRSQSEGYKVRIVNEGKEALTSCVKIVQQIVDAYRLNKITDKPESHRKYLEPIALRDLDENTGEEILFFKIKLTENENHTHTHTHTF